MTIYRSNTIDASREVIRSAQLRCDGFASVENWEIVEDDIECATSKDTIAAWRAMYGDVIPPGHSINLVLADGTPQGVEVVAVDVVRKMYLLGIECMICAKSNPPRGFFEKDIPFGFTDVPRTCSEHKGLWKPGRTAAKRLHKQAVRDGRRPKPVKEAKTPMALLTGVLGAYETIGTSMVRDEILEQVVRLIPPPPEGERDTRHYRVDRAIKSLEDRGKVTFD